MKIPGTIQDVLLQKGFAVWSIGPDATVFQALESLAEKNAGVLLVMEQDRLVGVFSERDYTRKVTLQGRVAQQTCVREIMSTLLITVTREHSVEECLRLMTEKPIRHLPVREGDRIVGLVSIRNLVNWVISVQSAAIGQLENYISGRYPA